MGLGGELFGFYFLFLLCICNGRGEEGTRVGDMVAMTSWTATGV
jgi:hypothetical protein